MSDCASNDLAIKNQKSHNSAAARHTALLTYRWKRRLELPILRETVKVPFVDLQLQRLEILQVRRRSDSRVVARFSVSVGGGGVTRNVDDGAEALVRRYVDAAF